MKSFATRIDIQAPVDKIWQILTDLPRWTQWNSTVERTVGNVERGAKVTVFVKQSPGRAFPLAGLIGKSIPDLQPAFDEFAQCLKREAERR
jgi:Polyketide cyclase / dehydrase and lipid transport